MAEELMDDNREILVQLAEATIRLQQNDDWKLIIDEGFFTAFAVTNVYNSWALDTDGRRRFLEKTLSRGHLAKYLDDIVDDGRNAKSSLMEEQE